MLAPAIPSNEPERLAALYELKMLDTPPEERFDRITRLSSVLFRVPMCLISLIDSDRQWFKSACGLDTPQTARDVSFCGHVILSDEPLVVRDAAKDVRFFDNPLVTGEPKIRFYAGHPLRTGSGHNIGSLCVIDHVPREFSDADARLLADIAGLVEDQLNLLDIVELQGKIREAHQQIEVTNRDLEIRNAFLQRVFGRYVSNTVFERLLAEDTAPSLGGEQRTVTVLMSDLRDFTPLTERYAPEEVVRTLNNYFGSMVGVIERHEGTLDNIIGDGLLVVFNGLSDQADHVERAARCALEMQGAMAEVNARATAEGLPQLAMGIGINSGEAIVGNIGSELQMKHSVIGRAVNVVARIVGHSIPGQILISDTARAGLGDHAEIAGGLKVQLKGISEPVMIYDLTGLGAKR